MAQLSSDSFKVTSMSIDQLNKEYAIADHLKFIKGRGGFPFILIKNASATALVSLYAAQHRFFHFNLLKNQKIFYSLAKNLNTIMVKQ